MESKDLKSRIRHVNQEIVLTGMLARFEGQEYARWICTVVTLKNCMKQGYTLYHLFLHFVIIIIWKNLLGIRIH